MDQKLKNGFKFISIFASFIIICIMGAGFIYLIHHYREITTLYGIDHFKYKTEENTTVLSSDGTVLAVLYDKNRHFVPLNQISQPMQQSILAIEDRRFRSHFGVDFLGTLRALWVDYRSGEAVQGGSTITQQLVKNLFLSNSKTYQRKIDEALLAIAFEHRFTKDEILEMYLNEVYFGNGCYGVEAAAKKYFNKKASQLDYNEATLLAGLPNAPSTYDPYKNLNAAMKRREAVINSLEDAGWITADKKLALINTKPAIQKNIDSQEKHYYKFPYFTSEVVQQLFDRYGRDKVYNSGYKVYTTVNARAETAAENIAREKIRQYQSSGLSASNMAIVSVATNSGAVTTLVGGVDFNTDQNNLALIPRQPGSAIKPLNYAAAMDKGLIGEYTVLNASSRYFSNYFVAGEGSATTTVKDAIKYSINVPAVEVLSRLSPARAIANLKKLGITTVSKGDNNLALALGGMTYGIKPLELAAAYVPFSNGGYYYQPYFIKSIKDYYGNTIFQQKPVKRQVFSSATANIMNDILTAVVNGGTGTQAWIPGGAAGKTGTTDDSRCLWFVGYNSDLATAVWVGNTNNLPIGSSSGGESAAPVWSQYMSELINEKIIPARGVPVTTTAKSIPAQTTAPGATRTEGNNNTTTTPDGQSIPVNQNQGNQNQANQNSQNQNQNNQDSTPQLPPNTQLAPP